MADIKVGAQVLVNNKYRAVVKYIGPTKFADGEWYGLELDREIGKHEGTVLGVTYFTAEKKHGTFVKRDNISVFDVSEEAAASIGAAARGALAKKRVKQEVAWRTFNTLEAGDEAQALARQARLVGTSLGQQLSRDRPSADELDAWEKEASHLSLPPNYSGAHVAFPLTSDGVWQLMQAFKAGQVLHYKYAFAIINAYRRYAGSLPTLVEVPVTVGQRLTVCGDTHGQLADLLSIYTINGIPSPSNRYLMNGDFVDRGDYGAEIVLLLMAFNLLYPGTLHGSVLSGAACMMNRGNHETHAQNVTGGFLNEVLLKYATQGCALFNGESALGEGGRAHEGGRRGSAGAGAVPPVSPVMDRALRLYDAFHAAFDCMPLATIVSSGHEPGKRLFVVHGGLLARPGVMLAQISGVKRKRDIPYGLPGFEDKLFEDLMWSDPRTSAGTSPSDRGAGVFFGSDVTSSFCTLNRIALVLRSHECVPDGFAFMHDSKLLTIFSASRYCGRGNNSGAFISFEPDLSYAVHSFVACSLGSTAPARIYSGVLTDAGRACEAEIGVVTGVLFAVGGQAGPIAQPTVPTLKRVGSMGGGRRDPSAEAAQAEAVRKMLVERICLRKSDLYFYFSTAERGGPLPRDGRITKLVWADGMRTVLDLDLPWLTLCQLLTQPEADGRINYTRFLDKYRIAMRSSDLAWMESLTEKLSTRLFSAAATVEAAYAALDLDDDGQLELDEIEKGLAKMGLGLTKSQLYELVTSLDTNKDGRISLGEFKSRFQLTFSRLRDEKAGLMIQTGEAIDKIDDWSKEALKRVGQALFHGLPGGAAPAVYASLDTDGDGLVSGEDFDAALVRQGLAYTPEERKRITALVDANASGNINYLEFVNAFKVEDVAGPESPSAAESWVDNTAVSKEVLSAVTHDRGRAAAGVSASPPVASGSASTLPSPGPAEHGSTWQSAIIDKIIAVLYEYRVEMAACFNMFDTDRSGKISAKEFRVGLQALTSLTGSPITDEQADELLNALDRNKDGEIDFQEFIEGFKLVEHGKDSASQLSPSEA